MRQVALHWLYRYIFVPNFTGMLIGLFLFLVSYGIGIPDKQDRDKLTAAALILAAVLPLVGALERLVLTSDNAGQQVWGYTGAHLVMVVSSCCVSCSTAPNSI